MSGASFMDELDCGSYQFDNYFEYPADNETEFNLINCDNFPSLWTDNCDTLPVCTDPIFSGGNSDGTPDLPATLPVPPDEIAHLEWLSHFLEDSFTDGGLTMTQGAAFPFKGSAMASHQFQISSPVSVLESSCSSSSSSSYSHGMAIPLSPTHRGTQRARSKRPRPATFNPRPAIQLISPSSEPKPVLIPVPILSSVAENFLESPHIIKTAQKKKKKLKPSDPLETNQKSGPALPRKCMHCEITKTPQWRAGPMGPKTLCNACGVRYKSGRLFPEYRPAASPTFVPSIHSNSHKKVVEMRAKGTEENVEPDPQLILAVEASAE